MVQKLRVLIVTNLFPSNVDPGYAPFNRQQFTRLGELADVDVFGVVPWRFGRFYASGSSKGVVKEETIESLYVLHPRYPSIPGVPSLNAALLAAALAPKVAWRARRRGYDVLLAAYAYPDGCAGIALGRMLGIPVVVKCHGSDLNRVPNDPPARFQIERLLPRAGAVVTVSKKLKERARELGVPEAKIHVVYNGIDRDIFKLVDRHEARLRLRLPIDSELVLYVGHLAPHKGVRELLDAIPRLRAARPGATVIFVGEGPLASLVQDAAEQGSRGGVLAVGRVPHDEVANWMSASDVVCVPSWDEGMPNVVREAHACGRPVVGTAVGGVPEAIDRVELGRLVPPKDSAALALAIESILRGPRAEPELIERLAVVPTWRESAQALHRVLSEVALRPRAEGESARADSLS